VFPPDNLNPFLKDILSRLSGQNTSNDSNSKKSSTNNTNNNSGISIAPSQALIIAGIIGGVLEVTSVLVDKDQLVQIVLTGSLKRKSELDKMMDHLGDMPFEDVMKAILEKFS
jgi:hypothetical protein